MWIFGTIFLHGEKKLILITAQVSNVLELIVKE